FGLLRRDFGALILAVLIPPALVLAAATHGERPWWAIVGLTAFAVVGAVFFIWSAMSSITVAGDELRSRSPFAAAVRCRVSDIQSLYLSNEGVIFGMTRPWGLWVDLPFGRRTCLYGDVKRLDWLAVFRLADRLNLRCDGPAAP